MADLGHELTDKRLKELEKRIAAEYQQATAEVRKKLEDYLRKVEAGRKQQEALYKAGKITKQEYSDWCYRHMMVGARWENMRDVLADDFHNANQIALKMAHDEMPDIYALNGNYALYRIEHDAEIDTGLALYNHDTAEYLLGDQRQLMPKPSTKKAREIAANKDMQWNMQKIQSAVLQGVLQGESPFDVAKRLQSVGQMNYNAAVRYARTMTTSAQNAGRYEAFRRAERLGVDLTIEWQATLDHRTRHEHRLMHGQRTDVDKPFHTPDGYTIYYPADCTGSSNAPQKEIWNCRCTLLSWVKGFEGETVTYSPKMGDMTYEEWQEAKPQSKPYTQETSKSNEQKPKSVAQQKKESYFKPLSSEQFGGREDSMEGFSAEELDAVNARFKELDEKYHARVTSITTTLERDQREYDIYHDNYVNKLLSENPRMRKSTAHKRAVELLGERPTKTPFELAGDYLESSGEMTLNTRSLRSGNRIADDIEYRRKRAEINAARKADGRRVRPFANAGNTAESTFIHEYGHAIDATYGVSTHPKFLEFYSSLDKDEIASMVSTYAATNEKEFVAECFCESFMGDTQGELSKRFMKILEEIIG